MLLLDAQAVLAELQLMVMHTLPIILHKCTEHHILMELSI